MQLSLWATHRSRAEVDAKWPRNCCKRCFVWSYVWKHIFLIGNYQNSTFLSSKSRNRSFPSVIYKENCHFIKKSRFWARWPTWKVDHTSNTVARAPPLTLVLLIDHKKGHTEFTAISSRYQLCRCFRVEAMHVRNCRFFIIQRILSRTEGYLFSECYFTHEIHSQLILTHSGIISSWFVKQLTRFWCEMFVTQTEGIHFSCIKLGRT